MANAIDDRSWEIRPLQASSTGESVAAPESAMQTSDVFGLAGIQPILPNSCDRHLNGRSGGGYPAVIQAAGDETRL
jgi:hypothetical protein